MALRQPSVAPMQEGAGWDGLTFASSVVRDAAASGGAALGATSFARHARTYAVQPLFKCKPNPFALKHSVQANTFCSCPQCLS